MKWDLRRREKLIIFFTLGFYCTESEELAKEWACTEKDNGYANKYSLDVSNLTMLNLSSGDYNILNWLAILLANRTFQTTSEISIRSKEYILENFLIPYTNYDIIKGYRADDSYFSFANAFLNNTISLSQLEKAMFLGKLGEQFTLKSKKAFNQLNFEQSILAEKEIYFPKKNERDTMARKEFTEEKRKSRIEDETYVLDIIRQKWKNEDERLRRILLK